jgi:hypothetical protein
VTLTIDIRRVDVGDKRTIVERSHRSGEVVSCEVREADYPNRVIEGDVAQRAFARAFPTTRPDRWWDR